MHYIYRFLFTDAYLQRLKLLPLLAERRMYFPNREIDARISEWLCT